MDFSYSDEQLMLQDVARRIAKEKIAPSAEHFDATGEYPLENIRLLGENGLMGIEVPVEYGGSGMDPVSSVLAIIEVSAADAAHDLVKAVSAFEEDQVAQPTDGRPGMVLVPVGQRDEPGGRYAGGRCAGLRGGIVGLGSLLRTRGTAWLGLGLVSSRTRKEKSHEAFLYIGGLLVTPVVVPKWA